MQSCDETCGIFQLRISSDACTYLIMGHSLLSRCALVAYCAIWAISSDNGITLGVLGVYVCITDYSHFKENML